MTRGLLAVLACLPLALLSGACVATAGQRPPSPAVSGVVPPDAAPLELVIAQVDSALNQYQRSVGGGRDALPPLSSAEFVFQTTTATTVGGTINLLIFKIGGSHENDVVNEVTYTYSVPPPPLAIREVVKPPTLSEALAGTIQRAARAVKTASTAANLPFSELTVTIQYGVTWEGDIGANVPLSFVTVGLSGAKNQNTVQSVKLVFGK
jgi:hypothetical protein